MKLLKNIENCISPELIKFLMEMGHGDRVVIADANFPAAANAKNLVRADGISGDEMLEAILKLMPIDTYREHAVSFMQHGEEIEEVPIWKVYEQLIQAANEPFTVEYLERFAFYEEAANSYLIIATSEKQLYANVILTKGVL